MESGFHQVKLFVWKGRDEQDAHDGAGGPDYIQETIDQLAGSRSC